MVLVPIWSFALLASLCVGAVVLGVRLGSASLRHARLTIAVSLIGLLVWAWLTRHPEVAVRLVGADVLAQVEGVGCVPLFMLIVGVAWARSTLRRQKQVVAWAAGFGGVFFLHGGMWMLQATPSASLAQTAALGPTMQSDDYTCVPAACATALGALGVHTSEAEMARLTFARPGMGSTTVRALSGLQYRLTATPWTAELIAPAPDELRHLPMPALTPMQIDRTQRHMVTLLAADRSGVWVADPVSGVLWYGWPEFDEMYTGQVIVFTPRAGGNGPPRMRVAGKDF